MDEETTTIAEDTEESNGSGRKKGHGFVYGMVMGTLAGAAAATLFAPATGEEFQQDAGHPRTTTDEYQPSATVTEGAAPEAAVQRVRALLTRIRSRVRDAQEDGRIAGQEKEAAKKQRFEELTHSD